MKLNFNTTFYFYCAFILLALVLFQTKLSAQQAKVVGYMPTYHFEQNSSVSYCKVTHLNICFANPDSYGFLHIDNFTDVYNKAREDNPNIVICVSVGGGGLSETTKKTWSDLIDKPENRPAFVSKIMSFVRNKKIDGIDVDLEWSAVTSGYTGFVLMLADSLHAAGKIMTSALPGTYRYPQVTDEVLAANDFINIMAYDETGPWDPGNPGQHSSYNFAQRSLSFWKYHGLTAERMILGVPFYGYNFNGSTVTEFFYRHMVDIDVKYADLDNRKNAYYNGRPTIRKKVELASVKAGGIMIWELSQDHFDEYSLLTVIHEKYDSLGFTTTGLCKNPSSVILAGLPEIKLYPNPASSVVYFESGNGNIVSVRVYDLVGKEIMVGLTEQNNRVEIDVSGLKQGIYIARISGDDFVVAKKLVVQ